VGKKKDRAKTGRLGLYAPRFWPSWLIVGVTWLLAKLPMNVQHRLTSGLTTLALKTRSSRIKIVHRNIELCFPELSPQQHEELVKKNLYSTLLMLFDLVNIVWNSRESNLNQGRMVGEEYLHQALATDKPLLLVSGHANCFLPAITLISTITPFSVVYRRMDNPVLEAQLYQRGRKHYPVETIHRKETRYMLKKLVKKGVILVIPDQDFGGKRNPFIPFFGIDTATITAIPKYATFADANVLLYYTHREPDGRYIVEVEPMLENYPSGDDIADTVLWSDWLERKIREHPEDYLWLHRRFKSRPKGEAKLY